MSKSDFALADMQRSDHPPTIYRIINEHLSPFESDISTDELRLSLYKEYFGFIAQAINCIHYKFNTCIRPIPVELFESFELLLDHFMKISSVMSHNHLILVFEAWWSFITCYKDNHLYDPAISQIEMFFGFLGVQYVDGTIVPVFDEARDKKLSNIILEVLVVYVTCLANNHHLQQLLLVIDAMQPWRVLDEDIRRFRWLVRFLIETTRYLLVKKPDMSKQEGRLTAKLTAMILLESMQVSRVYVTQELRTLIKLENFSTPDFLSAVLDHVAKKTNAEDTNELDGDSTYQSCLIQLQLLEENGILHPTICNTIKSTISNMLLPNLLHKQEKSIKYIASARECRMEGIERLGDSIKNLDKALLEIGDLKGKKYDEYGVACHVRAQALCLRALCNSEKFQNSEVSFKEDIKEAIQLWLDTDYCRFVAKHAFLSLTNVKLLCYVCDMILEVQTDGDMEIYRMLIKLVNQSSNCVRECIASLWQPRLRNNTLWTSHESYTFLEAILTTYKEDWVSDIATSYDIKEIDSSSDVDKLKHTAFELERKDPGTIKSVYLAACIYYHLGDKMISEGSFSEALCYSKRSCMLRESLFLMSFRVSREGQDGSMTIRCHVDPSLAANAWSAHFEDFILTPNSILRCYLESMLQVGTILEFVGDAIEAERLLFYGKDLSLERGFYSLSVCFFLYIAKLYHKTHRWDLAKQMLLNARTHCSSINCKKTKAVLEDELNLGLGSYYTNIYCNEPTDKNYELAITQLNSLEICPKTKLLMSSHVEEKECGCEFTYSDPSKLDRRICLLTQKAKCLVAIGAMESAQNVLLESARLVMHVKTFCSLHSERAFSNLVEHVKKDKIKHGVDIADLLYMMSWVSLMKLDYKDTRKKSSSKYFTPPLTIIAGLKLALIMSSKVPELLKKVAQLLAILFVLPNFDPQVGGALSACQWSCFCHHLTLGSNLSSIYYSQLKEMYHVSDPDAILHSLAPNLDDVGLEDFVIKYFRDLPPHMIVGMTVLEEKYMGLLEILLGKSFTRIKNGAQYMMLSRFKSNGEPLVVLLPIEPIEVLDGSEHCPSLCRGTGRHQRCRWGTDTIVDQIVPGFRKLSAYIASSFIPHDEYTEQDESSVLQWKKCLDARVGDLLSRMEKWFGDWINILLGEEDMSGCYIGTSQEARSCTSQRKRQRVRFLSTEPMFLMLDNGINMLPLEGMAVLRYKEIYRMPSTSSIFYAYWRLNHSDKKKVQDSQVLYPVLNPRNAYYVVNPDNTVASADQLEIQVAQQLSRLFIKGKFLKQAEAAEILNILATHDLYLYMGHGDGFQYVPRDKVIKLLRCAATALIGCDSALLVLNGPYIPRGAPLDYILAGSPIAIGNLWGVFPFGSSVCLMELFNSWIGEMAKDGEACIGAFLEKARNSQSHMFKNLDGAGLVCYGIPTRIEKEKPKPKPNIQRRAPLRKR